MKEALRFYNYAEVARQNRQQHLFIKHINLVKCKCNKQGLFCKDLPPMVDLIHRQNNPADLGFTYWK